MTIRTPPPAPQGAALALANRSFYERLWAHSKLVPAHRFNTWPLVRSLLPLAPSRLEVAPGLSPRLPLAGTEFVDLSAAAVEKLSERGAAARVGSINALPFDSARFDLVAALDILEHVEDDEGALAELARVAKPGATLLLSAPLHEDRFTAFDALVGHGRRYTPGDLASKLARHGFRVERSAVYGLQPRSPKLLDFVVWSFRHRPARATWVYTRLILPIGAFFQPKLRLIEGALDLTDVDEVLLVCRRIPV